MNYVALIGAFVIGIASLDAEAAPIPKQFGQVVVGKTTPPTLLMTSEKFGLAEVGAKTSASMLRVLGKLPTEAQVTASVFTTQRRVAKITFYVREIQSAAILEAITQTMGKGQSRTIDGSEVCTTLRITSWSNRSLELYLVADHDDSSGISIIEIRSKLLYPRLERQLHKSGFYNEEGDCAGQSW